MMGDLKGKNEHIPIYTIKATFYPGTDFLLTEDLQKFKISSSHWYLRYDYPKYYTIKYLGFLKKYCILQIMEDETAVSNPDYKELVKKAKKIK